MNFCVQRMTVNTSSNKGLRNFTSYHQDPNFQFEDLKAVVMSVPVQLPYQCLTQKLPQNSYFLNRVSHIATEQKMFSSQKNLQSKTKQNKLYCIINSAYPIRNQFILYIHCGYHRVCSCDSPSFASHLHIKLLSVMNEIFHFGNNNNIYSIAYLRSV